MKNLIIILQVLCLGPNKEKETLINIRLYSGQLGVGAGSVSHSSVLVFSEKSAPQLSFHRAFPDI